MGAKCTAVVLIDLENQTDLSLETLQEQLGQRFYLVGQLAFADYSRPSLKLVASRLSVDGVTQIHVDTFLKRNPQDNGVSYRPNGVDQVMAKILDRFAGRDYIATIVVVSGDNYFTRHVRRARQLGKRVIVAANPDRAGWQLRHAANEYIPLPKHRIN